MLQWFKWRNLFSEEEKSDITVVFKIGLIYWNCKIFRQLLSVVVTK